MALALYDSLAADAATAPADEAVAPAPVAPTEAATAAAEVISLMHHRKSCQELEG